ncbi:hypothetical protein CPB85DRAFT_1214014, partial [Mucidula mucida]
SDSTGNTKSARENINTIFPTIVILPNLCHHLANKIKDICKLEYFKEVCSVCLTIFSLIRL